MLNDLVKKHKTSFKAITPVSALARSRIHNVGAAVSFKPVEFIPLVVSWIFKTLEGQEFFKWLQSEPLVRTLQQVVTTAGQLVQQYLDEMPYELLLNNYGFTLCEYWRARPHMPPQEQFEAQLHQRLERWIMGVEGADHATYRPVCSERPNWICVFTVGGIHQDNDLTFAMNLNQHLLFDPRTGEFGCTSLGQLCKFAADYLFTM